MCGRFEALEYDDVVEVAAALETGAPLTEYSDWPTRGFDVFPRREVPIVVMGESGALEARSLIWGFVPEGHTDLVFNTRVENASKLPLWQESLEQRRCIVPTLAFFERHRSEEALSPLTNREIKQLYRFASGSILLMAGIWRDDRFSVLTTRPNASVRPIHDRMPILLTQTAVQLWVSEGLTALSDQSGFELSAEPVFQPLPVQESLF